MFLGSNENWAVHKSFTMKRPQLIELMKTYPGSEESEERYKVYISRFYVTELPATTTE